MIPIQATTVDELVKAVAAAVKLQKWHTYVGVLNGKEVRVKVYGLYLQIFDINGIRHGRSFDTQRAMKAKMMEALCE